VADIFISYSKREPELTVELARDLEERGYSTWWDTSILPGEEFPETIRHELDIARAVIVIWTINSVASSWVRAEAHRADTQNKLITLCTSDLAITEIPLPFNTRQVAHIMDREKIYSAVDRYFILSSRADEKSSNPQIIEKGAGLIRALTSARASSAPQVAFANSGSPGLSADSTYETQRERVAGSEDAKVSEKFKGLSKAPSTNLRQLRAVALFSAFVSGISLLIYMSTDLNHLLVTRLELNSDGPTLNGSYLFPKNLFIICVVLTYISLVTSFVLIFMNLDAKKVSTETELIGLRQDLEDAIRFANNITESIYPGDKDVPRFDILDVSVRHVIWDRGDTDVEATFLLKCIKETAHFWTYWIEADEESDEIKFLRQLNFQVVDVEIGQKLDWLPTQSAETTKVIAIFFREFLPGTQKQLRISYRWPGYMKKIIGLGAADFHWRYVSHNVFNRARIRKEWLFVNRFAPLECRLIEPSSDTASVRLEQRTNSFAWVYEDPYGLSSAKCAVEFLRPSQLRS
jgi:hypothetical protein